ncbi:MAG: WGR domain-containing protein [Chthoniobacter sp.]|uniref:WGR domain-containing protein n=1 Tax=Chthoniobacter sp. TaxID=2510640 RepID=UPI0032A7A0CD
MEQITLFYRQGSADKQYQASIQPKDGGYVVLFQFGRRGSALQSGTKTQAPVPYDQAKRIYDQLVASKVVKGYSPGEDGTPYQQTDKANQATGIHCQLLNPVEDDQVEKLIADPAWWLQPKHDGRRLLIRKMGATITGINRLGLAIALPQSLVDEAVAWPRCWRLKEARSFCCSPKKFSVASRTTLPASSASPTLSTMCSPTGQTAHAVF